MNYGFMINTSVDSRLRIRHTGDKMSSLYRLYGLLFLQAFIPFGLSVAKLCKSYLINCTAGGLCMHVSTRDPTAVIRDEQLKRAHC